MPAVNMHVAEPGLSRSRYNNQSISMYCTSFSGRVRAWLMLVAVPLSALPGSCFLLLPDLRRHSITLFIHFSMLILGS